MRWILGCSLFLLWLGPAFAAPTCDLKRVAVLPITMDRTVPTVEVGINGHRVRMIIDTGSNVTLLTPEQATAMHLLTDPNHTSSALGSTGYTKTSNAVIDWMELGSIRLDRLSVPTASLKPDGANPVIGGILGGSILSRFDIDYNQPALELSLYQVKGCLFPEPPWERPYQTLNGSVYQARLRVPVSVDGHSLMALVDTGAEILSVARGSLYQLGLGEGILANDLTRNVTGIGGGTVVLPYHRFASIQIGDEVFRGGMAIIQDYPILGASMLIGEEYMAERRLWLSYSSGRMFVQIPSQMTSARPAPN
jgi:predicted aspartyl protease